MYYYLIQSMSRKNIFNPFLNKEITLIFLQTHFEFGDFSGLDYLQSLKTLVGGSVRDDLARARKYYFANLEFYKNKLRSEMEGFNDLDVVVSCPSKSNLQNEYFEMIVANCKHTYNISENFTKAVKAGETNNFDEFYNGITYEEKTQLSNGNYEKLLVVDDVYSSGITVAAIVKKLASEDITFRNIYAVAPLYMEKY